MNKHLITTLVLLASSQFVLAEPVSLRGNNPIDQLSAEPKKYAIADKRPKELRRYIQQPPTIPHSIEGYQITSKFNQCQSCHSWSNYQRTGAVKISLTHFMTRDGVELSDVSPRRYVCTTCHVPQSDATPLVENTFKPIDLLK